MVTKFCRGLVRRIVGIDFFLLQNVGFKVKAEQLLLECRGSIIGTEYFRRETFHIRAQMVVHRARLWGEVILSTSIEQKTHRDSIKEHVSILLWLGLEQAEILENLWINVVDFFVVPDRVLAQKVQNNEARLVQRDMLQAQGATANGVCFILSFLVTCSKRVLVDQVHCSRSLTIGHDFGLQISLVILSNAVDMFL
jgi:hypothetical protein